MASRPGTIEIFSEDPEIMALQALIKALRHFGPRGADLTVRHMKVLFAVELCCKLAKRPAKMADIEQYTRLKPKEFETEVNQLVALRYLHEVVPTFGELVPAYKLGSMGGTVMRTMFAPLRAANSG